MWKAIVDTLGTVLPNVAANSVLLRSGFEEIVRKRSGGNRVDFWKNGGAKSTNDILWIRNGFLLLLFFCFSLTLRCGNAQANHPQVLEFQLFDLFLVGVGAIAGIAGGAGAHSIVAVDGDELLYAPQNDRRAAPDTVCVGRRDRERAEAHAFAVRSEPIAEEGANQRVASDAKRANRRQTARQTRRILRSRRRSAGQKAAHSRGTPGGFADENRGNRGTLRVRGVADCVLFRGEGGAAVSTTESADVFAAVAREFEFVLPESAAVRVAFGSLLDAGKPRRCCFCARPPILFCSTSCSSLW